MSGLILYAGFLYVSGAMHVKRLHDRDKSAWWLAFFWGAPVLIYMLQVLISNAMGTDVETAIRGDDPSLIVTLLMGGSIVIGIWLIIELWLLPSTKGPNQYGPDVRDKPPNLRFPEGYKSPTGDTNQ